VVFCYPSQHRLFVHKPVRLSRLCEVTTITGRLEGSHRCVDTQSRIYGQIETHELILIGMWGRGHVTRSTGSRPDHHHGFGVCEGRAASGDTDHAAQEGVQVRPPPSRRRRECPHRHHVVACTQVVRRCSRARVTSSPWIRKIKFACRKGS
jgi:hypothetical protein